MQRYFIKEAVTNNQIILSGESYHHVKNVMRNQLGDILYVVDKNQVTYKSKISAFEKDQVILEVLLKETEQKELPVSITIACGFPKGEKLDFIVQKSTELGMSQCWPFPSSTSVVKWDQKKRLQKEKRLQKIAVEASQQSQRIVIPEISLLDSFATLIQRFNEFDTILVAYEEEAKAGSNSVLYETLKKCQGNERILVIFGPEGGLTPKEVATFKENGATLVALGPRILRTETAPLYFLSVCSYQFELMNSY